MRFLATGPGAPGANMALDEALFEGVLAGGEPFLRVYTWQPSGLTLGRFQRSLAGLDTDYVRRAGIPVVRRMTGGRAVLHDREVTYSFASRHDGLFAAGGVLGTYEILARALARALEIMGLTGVVLVSGRRRGVRSSPDCFHSSSFRELTWRGRKMVGSAQVRRRGGFLQHGAIKLAVDSRLWRAVFPGTLDPAADAVGLEEILDRPVGFQEVASALRLGFSETLRVGANDSIPLASELAAAEGLILGHYAPLDLC